MSDCLFCDIVNKEIPATVEYEDDEILAFEDINPVAPVHLQIIPKIHIATINDLSIINGDLVTKMFLTAKKLAADRGIDAAETRR